MFDSDIPQVENSTEVMPAALQKRQRRMGQALVEYVLIVVLVSLAVAAALTATGPAIGNVFSNVVYNLLGETSVPYSTLNSNQFWNYVTAVANYKPDVQGIMTNTAVGYATNTPINTSTAGPSPTATVTRTATTTATVGPSPTPVDISYSMPFVDTADESPGSTKWHYQFTDAFAAAPWTVAFYGSSTWAANGAFGGTLSSGGTHVCTTNLASVVPCFSDVNTSWVAAPDTGVGSSGWSAKYIYSNAPFEGREYQVSVQLGQGDGAVFKIGATQVFSIAPGASVVGSYNQLITPQSFRVTAGNYPVEVDFYAGAGSSHSIKLLFSTLADTGTCTWGTLYPGHSPNLSWQDANGGNYAVTSNCNLRLRGSIDLSTSLTGSARLTFFDKWNISTGAVAQVGIRNYNFSSNNDWTWVTVHPSGTIGNNWAYQYYDLTNFGGVNFMTGFASKRIEIAFNVVNQDPAVTAPGWFVDDITVEDNTINTYTIPVSDNSDTSSPLQWTPACNWAVTSQRNYPTTPGRSWSESPLGAYAANSDCSLYLNGVIDLTSYGGSNPALPQLLFYNQYDLTGTTTTLSVEVAPLANRNSWTPLSPFGSVNPWVAQGTGSVSAWTLETFNLNNLAGGKYFFRFRFVSDSTGSTGLGWFIDNIQWRERPLQAVGIPFAETFSNSDNWTASSKWGLTTPGNAVDGSPHQTDLYALTDSPGQSYVVPSTGTANVVQYTPQIIMSSAAAGFNPVMSFWTRWDTAASATMYLEGSIDGGINWSTSANGANQYTPYLWTYSNGQTQVSPFTTSITGGSFNTNKGWTRYVVPLKYAYPSTGWPCTTTCANLSIRFRLVTSGGSADGIYIGDIAVYDANVYNQSFTNSVACQANGICNPSPRLIANNPFTDSAEAGINNWYVGGDWNITATTGHGSTHSWTSTPSSSSTYTDPANDLLEIAPTLDFTGVTKPVVSFWTKYAINSPHIIKVDTSTNGGTTWNSAGQTSWITQPDTSSPNYVSGTNLGWTRQVIDLSVLTASSATLRIRFRLDALTNTTASSGWWLDDIYIGPLATLPGYNAHGMDYNDNFGNVNNVVTEGDWQSITDWGPYNLTFPTDNFQPLSTDYGNGQFNPLWDASYYHYDSTDPTFPSSTSGNSYLIPDSTEYCGNKGNQIGNATAIIGTPANYSKASMPKFSYTDGTPTATVTNDQHGIQVTGTGAGFSFTVTAGVQLRTLNVYVGLYSVSGASTTSTVTAQLASGGAPTYSDASAPSATQMTTTSKNTGVGREYTFTYSAAADGQLLNVQITGDANGYVALEGASLIMGGVSSGPSLTWTSPGYVLTSSSTLVNLTSEGSADYMHWGASGGTGFDQKNQGLYCVKPIVHQAEAAVSHVWDSTHIPANAGGNANWTTNANDYEYFVASYVRKYTVLTGGNYRFWAQADDGMRFLVDGTRVMPDATSGNYPWNSANSNDWRNPGVGNYFYDVTLTAGVHKFELDYFQNTGSASVYLQGSEQNTMLHSSGKGINYSANQDTSAFTSGYITVQPSTTQFTTLSFYERFVMGSTSSANDAMYVSISIDGGFTWIKLNSSLTYNNPSTNVTTTGIGYGFNLNDSSSAVDPFVTYQNWQLHSVNLSSLNISGTPSVVVTTGGTPLISTTVPTNIMIRFELDARVSTAQSSGWYITNLNVIQK